MAAAVSTVTAMELDHRASATLLASAPIRSLLDSPNPNESPTRHAAVDDQLGLLDATSSASSSDSFLLSFNDTTEDKVKQGIFSPRGPLQNKQRLQVP